MGNENEVKVEIEEIEEIDVKPKKRGLLKVWPNSQGADFEDTIIWQSKCPFVIHFKGTSPVNKMIIHSRKEGDIHTADAKVVHDSDQFGGVQGSYFIACSKDDEMYVADPEIIVPRPKG